MRSLFLPFALALSTILLSTGCAFAPADEFHAYRASFDDVHAATDAFVDVFEPYERTNRVIAARSQPAFVDPYDPEGAAARRVRGEPVLAPLIVAGMDAVADYNEVLAHYAAGGSHALIRPRLDALASRAATLASTFGAASLAGVQAPAVSLVTQVLKAVGAATDGARFQQAVTENRGQVSRFLAALRDETPLMWRHASTAIQAKQSAALRAGNDDYDPVAEKMAFQNMLDAWVVSLQRLDAAVVALETAVATGAGTMSASRLVTLANDLRRHADDVTAAARAFRRAF